MGEFKDWQSFLEADVIELETLPRRMLKSGYKDVQINLSLEIRDFCNKNFGNMTLEKLDKLYGEIKAHRGLEVPLFEFEKKWSKIKPTILQGTPPHATIVLSLWGMQFKFPEDYLSKDIVQSLKLLQRMKRTIDKMNNFRHSEILSNRKSLKNILQKEQWASRSCILSCFNLLEAFLNGIAWRFTQNNHCRESLSKRNQQLIYDTGRVSFKKKVLRYPAIISGDELWSERDTLPNQLINDFKLFRDCLAHPSPFSIQHNASEYNKLQKFYSIDHNVALEITRTTVDIIEIIHNHIGKSNSGTLKWHEELSSFIKKCTI